MWGNSVCMRLSKRAFSEKQEKIIAKELGGKVTPNSGGLRTVSSWKGDINTDTEKLECKITNSNKYTLKFSDLSKIRSYAIKYNRDPVFLFEFASGEYKDKYVCLFESNSCEPLTQKSLLFSSDDLFKRQKLNTLVYQFKYTDKGIDRGISVYTYRHYLTIRNNQ